jgi:hypothetical protein
MLDLSSCCAPTSRLSQHRNVRSPILEISAQNMDGPVSAIADQGEKVGLEWPDRFRRHSHDRIGNAPSAK